MRILIFNICAYALLLSIFSSCQKTIDDPGPGPISVDTATIFGFKDSTLLIKSITSLFYDSLSDNDPESEATWFLYDTLNKKIVMSFNPISNSSQSYDGYELSYNSAGLLIKSVNKYSTQTPDPIEISSADYMYDGENIIKSSTVNLFNGESHTIIYNKTTLPSGGYRLNWLGDPAFAYFAGISYAVSFDSKGDCISFYQTNEGTFYTADSIIYDGNNNISKVMSTGTFDASTTNTPAFYTRYDFVSRDTKGNQVYNLFRVLFNGITSLPNTIGAFTIQGGLDDDRLQLTKFPALQTIITTGINNTANFNENVQYDSKNRLVKYRLFFNDATVYNVDYIITYYK